MRKTLIIADNDEAFVKILEEYIFLNHGDEFEIRTCTSKASLEKFFSTPRKVDILLLNPKFEFMGMKEQYIKDIVLICDDEDSSNLEYDAIFRFGELNVICNKLRNIDIKNDEEVEFKPSKFVSAKSEVTTVYSPIGGVGKTTIAIAMAVDLSLKGNSVLYLNLENMSSTNAYFKLRKTTSNLAHIIEQLSFGGSQLNQYINGSIVRDGETNINYINPSDNIFAIEQITSDDIKYLINTLKELKRFNHIIIDTSSTYDTFKKAIIDSSDKIIMPLEQSIIGKQKTMNFFNCIDETELNNFIPVINKYKDEIKNNINDITITKSVFHIQGIINYYEPLDESDSYIKIFNKHNPFTAAIKSLTN